MSDDAIKTTQPYVRQVIGYARTVRGELDEAIELLEKLTNDECGNIMGVVMNNLSVINLHVNGTLKKANRQQSYRQPEEDNGDKEHANEN